MTLQTGRTVVVRDLLDFLTEVKKQASSSSSSVGRGEVVGDASGSAGCLLERLGGVVQDDRCLGLDVVV
jgi:hypothetical protein